MIAVWFHRKQLHAVPVERELDVLRIGEPFDVLVAIARQPNLDFVGASEREGVSDDGAAASAERKSLE